MKDQQKAEARGGVESTLTAAFNTVGDKTVKIDDLIARFEEDIKQGPNKLGGIAGFFARRMVDKLRKKDFSGQEGVTVQQDADGNKTAYISSRYLAKLMLTAIDSGNADGHLDDVRKAGLNLAQALQQCTSGASPCKPSAPKIG